jgi:hypothetical protein
MYISRDTDVFSLQTVFNILRLTVTRHLTCIALQNILADGYFDMYVYAPFV